jgi:hypothetical protein
MPFFQKKPIIVEAARVTSLTVIPAHQTLHQHDLIADPGDWIIKGVKGEFYPCKDDVFRETYQPINGEAVKHILTTSAQLEGIVDDDEPVILAHPMRDAFIEAEFTVAPPA